MTSHINKGNIHLDPHLSSQVTKAALWTWHLQWLAVGRTVYPGHWSISPWLSNIPEAETGEKQTFMSDNNKKIKMFIKKYLEGYTPTQFEMLDLNMTHKGQQRIVLSAYTELSIKKVS